MLTTPYQSSSIASLLNDAITAHNQGKLTEAELLYKQILQHQPTHFDALHMLGLVLKTQGFLTEGLAFYNQATTVRQDIPALWCNRGVVLYELAQFEEAITSYDISISLQADYIMAWNNRANALIALSRHEEALEAYKKVATLQPNDIQALLNYGQQLSRVNHIAQAEHVFLQILSINPNHIGAYTNLALLYTAQNKLQDAQKAYQNAIRIEPNNAEMYAQLGKVLSLQQQDGDAIDAYLKSLEINPQQAQLFNNIGILHTNLNQHQKATQAYQQTIQLHPNYAIAYCNLGLSLEQQQHFERAEHAYKKALDIQPDLLECHWNLALLLLKLGRYAEGWAYHEVRYNSKFKRDIVPNMTFPMWQGESLSNKSILVWYEGGHGDEIQCARFLALLKAQGTRTVSLACKPALKTLFESSQVADVVLSQGDIINQHDFWTLPFSIPYHLKTTLDTIPTAIPYLSVTKKLIAHWQQKLPNAKLRVGLVWKGSGANKASLPNLAALAPLWDVANISFISLQKGQGEDEAKNPSPKQSLLHLGTEIKDFADAAAIISQLDLLISVDTAMAHLAGALGKPCWIITTPEPHTDWRWLQDRVDSPWYPNSVRLFRQTTQSTWQETVGVIKETLYNFAIECFHKIQPEPTTMPNQNSQQDIPNTAILLNQAIAAHNQGNLPTAETLYRQILTIEPNHFDALHMLGLVRKSLGFLEEGLSFYDKAATVRADIAELWCNRGVTLYELKRFGEALTSYNNALAVKTNYPMAWNNKGNALTALGLYAAAEVSYRQAKSVITNSINNTQPNRQGCLAHIPVIIPHYRAPEKLAKCIEHVNAQKQVTTEIFVRENSDDNILFTRAINQGLRKYCFDNTNEFVLVLNQDAYLKPDCLQQLIHVMDTMPEVGIACPIQLDTENRPTWFGSLHAYPWGRGRIGQMEPLSKSFGTFWANGACMLLRTAMIHEIGLFDENMRFICSDADYSFTARSRGWKVHVEPMAQVEHSLDASGKIPEKWLKEVMCQDQFYFAAKWLSGDVYRGLAHEGMILTPSVVEKEMQATWQMLKSLK